MAASTVPEERASSIPGGGRSTNVTPVMGIPCWARNVPRKKSPLEWRVTAIRFPFRWPGSVIPRSFRAMTSWLSERAMDARIRTSGCMGYLDTTANSDAVTTSSLSFRRSSAASTPAVYSTTLTSSPCSLNRPRSWAM